MKRQLIFYGRFLWLLFLPLAFFIKSSAQRIAPQILTFEQFKEVMREYHPVLLQANILLDNAKQEIRIARGPFDPTVGFQQKQKTFTGKEYYNYRNAEVTVPTWLGLDLSAGYENNGGLFTNDEVTLGESYYIGGSVSLTKGLYMNERRAALQQAKLLITSSEQERQLVMNDLFYDAYAGYYKWLNEYLKYRTYGEIYVLNQNRYELVKNSWRLGDAPAIDTTEALSQLQQFELFRNESYIKWIEEGIKLSKHIWDSSTYAQLVNGALIPDSASMASLQLADSSRAFWLAQTVAHPDLLLNDVKQQALAIKQKLNIQDLLPSLSLSAFKLQHNFGDVFTFDNTTNNNRYGVGIGVPLRLSKGRGNYQLTKNQLLSTQLERDFKQRKIENQVLFQLNEISITRTQLRMFDDFLLNITKLYQAENTKYELGSSTIFLINSRENKLLDIKIKRLENAVNYQLSILKLYYELVQVGNL